MISSAVGFKLLAASLALTNVVVAAAVLPTDQAVSYLATISFAQLVQPLAGFGLVTRLVAITDRDELLRTGHRPYFIGYAVLFAAVSAAVFTLQGAPVEMVVFAAVLVLQAIEAERSRAGFADHRGIYLQNAAVFLSAMSILILGEFTAAPATLVLVALIAFQIIVPDRHVTSPHVSRLTPRLADIVKGVRALTVNQFYSAVVVTSVFVLPASEALLVTLVYRTGLFFNWQIFYWMRYGHKDALELDNPTNIATNRRLGRLTLAAFVGAVAGALVVNYIPFVQSKLEGIEVANLGRLAVLIAAYGGVQFLFSRTFPFEASIVYRSALRADLEFLGLVLIAVVAVVVAGVTFSTAVAMLVAVELARVCFRLVSWRQSQSLISRTPSPGRVG